MASGNHTSVIRAGHSNWLIGFIAAIALIGLAVALFAAINPIDDIHKQQRAQAETQKEQAAQQRELDHGFQCMERWVNATTARTNRLTDLAKTRNAAISDVLNSALAAQTTGKTQPILRALHRFRRADAAYNRGLKNNPVPQPQFLCAERIARHHQPGPQPSPPTGTAHATVTNPGPTATAVIRVPGRTVTRTVTVTVPPGRGPGKGRAVTTTATVTVTAPNPLCTVVPGVDPC